MKATEYVKTEIVFEGIVNVATSVRAVVYKLILNNIFISFLQNSRP